MKNQAWDLGMTLGVAGQGLLEPLTAADHPKRAGIGYGESSRVADTDSPSDDFFAINSEDEEGSF